MGSDKRNHFLIACRYVPYDQWFLTNISPSWKVKHLKQSIIAKALNLPFDRRLLMQDSPTVRPPSPITFAPIEGETEFSGGFGSHEADRIHADHKIQGQRSGGISTNDFSIAGFLPDRNTTSQPGRNAEGAVPNVEPSFAEYEDQIYTTVFTLIRFSTGQILEELSPVSWYNLGPHELVELHCSSPPITFARAVIFGPMLTNGGSVTVDIPTTSILGSRDASNSNSALSPAPPLSSKSRTATLTLALADPSRLTSLPRHNLASYIEPYWEGWVRVLRVMPQPDVDPPTGRLAETTPGFGSAFSPEGNVLDSGRRYADLNDRRTKMKEWRERWAVIRNGVLSLCKNCDDPTCTRLPLSALVSLCGAEYFSFGHSDNDQPSANLPSGGDNYKRHTSSHSNLPPNFRPHRTAAVSESPRVTTPAEIADVGARKFLLTATSSNSPTAPRVLSPLITQSNSTRVGTNTNLTTPIDPFFSNHNFSNTLLPIDPERSRRERAAVRELERERMQEEMATKARLDKQVGWEDFGIVFGGKSKAKSKEKEKDRSRDGTVREERQQKTKKNPVTGSLRQPLIGEGGPDKDEDRDRQGGKDRQRGKLQNNLQGRFFHPDDRYIPASREDAIAKGMLIVCARFRVGIMEDPDKAQVKACALSLLDSSVARNEGDGTGSKDGCSVEDRVLERKAEWHRSQVLESSPVMKSLPPPRKASLPGLGHGITPSGSIFGGFFGNKDKDNDKVEKNDKQDWSDVKDEEEKSKLHGSGNSIRSPSTGLTNLRGKSNDYAGLLINRPEMNDPRRLNLSVNTATLGTDAGILPALSSPDSNDPRFDDDRGVGYGYDDKYTEQQTNRDQKKRKKNEDRVEWVVLDMGTEIAYNSFLRILHRHFPAPMQSTFVHMSASPFQPPSHNAVQQQDIHGVPLALPYPEWRRDVVFRARSQGMRELGRPLELALYDRETRAAKPAQERRKEKSQNEPDVKGQTGCQNASTRRKDMSETDHVADNDPMGHDYTFGMEYLMLDDSDDDSEDESARWWQDIPRQMSLKDLEWSTTGHSNIWSGAKRHSPSTPDSFAFSPSSPDSGETTPVMSLDMEERLRPSISSSTLASNNTSSSMSSRSTTLGASPNLSFVSNGERAGIRECYQSRSYPRIVSPSQTLSSPSSNESLGSHLYRRRPLRPVLPNSDFYLPNTFSNSSGSPSVLHHSASMPNARSMPSSGGGIETDLNRERTVAAQTVFPDSQKPTRQNVVASNTPLDDPLSCDLSPANVDVLSRPILTLAQIHQIETDTEAKIGRNYTRSTHDTSSFFITDDTKRNIPTPVFNESVPSSIFQQKQSANDRYDRSGDDASMKQGCQEPPQATGSKFLDGLEKGDGSSARNNATRGFMNTVHPTLTTSTFSFCEQDYMGNALHRSVLDSASISAKAILRRVRSGSSLQTPMGVHFEEEDGGTEI